MTCNHTNSLVEKYSTEIALFTCHVVGQMTYTWISPDFCPAPSSDGFEDQERVTSEYVFQELCSLNPKGWRYAFDSLVLTGELSWLKDVGAAQPVFLDKVAFACFSELAIVNSRQAHLVHYHSPNYPPLLREIPDPPVVLTVVGNKKLLSLPTVSVVGARKASSFAMRESFLIGRVFAEAGLNVVSGGAFGCDIAAHQGVLSCGKSPALATVVLAGGLSATYPKANDYLFRKIVAEGGALVSERMWWTTPKPRDFASRNRIVSGMSPAVFVMQAGEKSGALITARAALDHGRDVWVLEHEQDDIRANGGSALIRDGALNFKGVDYVPEVATRYHKFSSQKIPFQHLC